MVLVFGYNCCKVGASNYLQRVVSTFSDMNVLLAGGQVDSLASLTSEKSPLDIDATGVVGLSFSGHQKSRVPQCSSARMSVMRGLPTPQCSASRQRTFQSRTPLASCLHASAGALSITEPRRMWRLMHLESFFLVFLYLASLEMEKLDVIA